MSEGIPKLENGSLEVKWAAAMVREKVRCESLKLLKSQISASAGALLLQQTKSISLYDSAKATTSVDSSPWDLKVSLMKAKEKKCWVELLGKKQIELDEKEFDILVAETQIYHYELDDRRVGELYDEQDVVWNHSSSSSNKRKFESLEVTVQESEKQYFRDRDEIKKRMNIKLTAFLERESQAAALRKQELEFCNAEIATLQESHFVAFGIRL
jgi:hypothetical protein